MSNKVHLHGSISNKGMNKEKCQKRPSRFIQDYEHLKYVLGIFQRGYYPRGCNYCTYVMSLLLGLITSKVSLTNHPKVKNKWNFLKVKMFISAHAFNHEQCSWWKDKKQSKRRSCSNQSEMDTSSDQYQEEIS